LPWHGSNDVQLKMLFEYQIRNVRKRNIEARSCNHCRSGKAISIAYCECVFVAVGIQHALRVHHIILSSVACPTRHYFAKLFHKLHDFRKKEQIVF
jgi:hypothetical protein